MRSYDFIGGLGDILMGLHHGSEYESLIAPKPTEIVIVSSNRGVRELFDWHPNRSLHKIVDLEYISPWDDEIRMKYASHRRTPPTDHHWRTPQFFPSPSDLEVLKSIPPNAVVFSLSCSNLNRNIPLELAEQVADRAIKSGLSVCVVGKTYESWNVWGGRRWKADRSEDRLRPRDGVIDLVDRLSVPGVAMLLKRAKASFCSYSAMMLLSWAVGCRCMALLAPVIEGEWNNLNKSYNIGGHIFSTESHLFFDRWNVETVDRFLESVR